MNKTQITEALSRLQKQNPSPTTELVYRNHFELLIAVILSAQATDISVNKATGPLFKKHPTPQAIVALGEEKLANAIRTIGLFRTKAKNVIKTCQLLISIHQGEVPNDRAALEALPGVGRKTANVILNTAFKEATIAVDTHIFRVANRTQMGPGKNVITVEQQLLKNIPERFKLNVHHWLILHGRYTCKAKNPLCHECIIQDLCPFPKSQKSKDSHLQ